MLILHTMYEIEELARDCEKSDPRYKRYEAMHKTFCDLLDKELHKPLEEQDLNQFYCLLYDDQGNAYRVYRKY